MNLLRLLSTILLAVIASSTFAQITPLLDRSFSSDSTITDEKSTHLLTVSYEGGGIMPYGSDTARRVLQNSQYSAIELRLGWQSHRPNVYANLTKYPVYGVGLYAGTFNNPVLGNPVSIFGFASFPLTQRRKRFNLNMDFVYGFAGNFNPYNKKTNPDNVIIGSRFNSEVAIGLNGNFTLTPRLILGAGIFLKHFSNGSSHKPNLGINMTPLRVSLTYRLEKRVPDLRHYEIPKFIRTGNLDVFLSAGLKQFDIDGPKYLKSGLGIFYMYQWRYQTRWGIGADFFYSGSGTDRVANGSAFSKSMSMAIVPSFDWIFAKRLYITLGLGFYTTRHSENDEWESFYERVALRYRFTEHLSVGVTIKAHMAVADYFEWTLGYSFHKKKNNY